MTDTPNRKPTLQELALGFAQVAKEQNVEVFVVLCGEVDPNGKFERLGYVDGDAVKLLHTLAGFLREKLPLPLFARFKDLLTQAKPPITEIGPQDDKFTVGLPKEGGYVH
jgi:hypothetical protein